MNETLFHILLILLALYLCLFVSHRIATREYRHGRRFAREKLKEGDTFATEDLLSFSWLGKQNQFTAGVRAELRAFEAKTRGEK